MRLNLAALLITASSMAVHSTPQPSQAASQPREGEFAARSTWQIPRSEEVRSQTLAWLREQAHDSAVWTRAEAMWPVTDALAGPSLLERVMQVFAMAHGPTRELMDFCKTSDGSSAPPQFAWLTEEQAHHSVRNNARLYFGRWLCQQRRYEEALTHLKGLQPADVVDPASLLFYQGASYHWLLDQEAGLESIARLLERPKEIPRRYEQLATLMKADLAALKEDSLDHISRRMGDIRRRLELGEAGQKTIEVENGVIASLDKLIKEMEDKQKQQQASSSSAPMQPSSPAQDSMPLGGKGPGEVVKKNIGSQSGWGDLPPKERQEALQSMGKNFPSHYREVVESYFRRLASESSDK